MGEDEPGASTAVQRAEGVEAFEEAAARPGLPRPRGRYVESVEGGEAPENPRDGDEAVEERPPRGEEHRRVGEGVMSDPRRRLDDGRQ